MSCKVGNQTNSQDPQAVNSRVFVGNLNTFQCSKTDVERMFQRYGRIAGISMHKGYAFIQFTSPFDARSACLGEDGRLLWGQTLDVNMVAEPKAHQTGRKRQNIAKTGNDWDYYYDSYYAQVGFPTPMNRLVPPPMKRARIHVPPNNTNRSPVTNKATSPNNNKSSHPNPNHNASLTDLKSYSTPDILICGNCRELFSEIEQLVEHKKQYCKLRFTCKCAMLNGVGVKRLGEEPAALLCSQCKDSFNSAWDLMVHVQAAHMMNIYQLAVELNSSNVKGDQDGKDENGAGSDIRSNGLMSDSPMDSQSCQTDINDTEHLETNSLPTSSSSSSISTCTSSLMTSNSTMNAEASTNDLELLLRHHQQLNQIHHPSLNQIHQSQIQRLSPNSMDSAASISPTNELESFKTTNNNHSIQNLSLSSPENLQQHQMNGNAYATYQNQCSVSTTTAQQSTGGGNVVSLSSSVSYPMEASTQTTNNMTQGDEGLLSTAKNGNFEEHCLLPSLKTEVHVPFTNGQVAGV